MRRRLGGLRSPSRTSPSVGPSRGLCPADALQPSHTINVITRSEPPGPARHLQLLDVPPLPRQLTTPGATVGTKANHFLLAETPGSTDKDPHRGTFRPKIWVQEPVFGVLATGTLCRVARRDASNGVLGQRDKRMIGLAPRPAGIQRPDGGFLSCSTSFMRIASAEWQANRETCAIRRSCPAET